MKTKGHKTELLRLVARQAVKTAGELQVSARADLFEGVALLLPKKEAESARHTAFLLRESERSQLQFLELLSADSENPKPYNPSQI